jgi:lysophospholipase L1-like esterase
VKFNKKDREEKTLMVSKIRGVGMSGFSIVTGQKIVLIGDSITDCGRRIEFPPLGNGYVSIAANLVTAKYPDRKIKWVNKGIGGDIVQGLVRRWTEDVIAEKPDWVSIAIGINNVYHDQISGRKLEESLKAFEDFYRQIIERTKKETTAKIILFDIFYVSGEDQSLNITNADKYNEVIHKLSSEYSTFLVSVQSAFRQAKSKRPFEFWTVGDGVHPSPVGHTLIALTFLESMRL